MFSARVSVSLTLIILTNVIEFSSSRTSLDYTCFATIFGCGGLPMDRAEKLPD